MRLKAFLLGMWNVAWDSLRHPLTPAVLDRRTGKVYHKRTRPPGCAEEEADGYQGA